MVTLLNVIKAANDKDVYLVFDHMDTDLHAVVRGRLLQDVHKRYVLYQVARGLHYMHSGEVIHRDLKPSNVLLNESCDAKLCDFGLARSVLPDPGDPGAAAGTAPMTDYVATRWYVGFRSVIAVSVFNRYFSLLTSNINFFHPFFGFAHAPPHRTPSLPAL